MSVSHLTAEGVAQFNAMPKLLIVDDQPVNIHMLHGLFRTECEVLMATSGEQALVLAQSQMPDLILLDVVMPGMSGHEVCRRLKADMQTRDIPIIFITGLQDDADEVFGFDLGAVDFISKPISPVVVKARVRTHLVLKQQTDLLRSIALVDGLTGISNRRKFDEDLQADWRQSVREKSSFSLIMIDIDYFKRYNDCYGHQAGDDCLIEVAQALKTTLRRPYDKMARYGGEEFVCLLPNTDAAGAQLIATKILNAVNALNIPHQDSDAADTVTISLGVATLTDLEAHTPQDLVEAADQQLYEAKHAGRARVSAALLN